MAGRSENVFALHSLEKLSLELYVRLIPQDLRAGILIRLPLNIESAPTARQQPPPNTQSIVARRARTIIISPTTVDLPSLVNQSPLTTLKGLTSRRTVI